MAEIEAGKTFNVKCPFVRSIYSGRDIDGPFSVLSWKPGIEWEPVGPDSSIPIAHGEGSGIYHIVDVHALPRPYPARVFYKRSWVDPDGQAFGKGALRITTVGAFRRRINGFRWPGFDDQEYELVEFTTEDKERLLKAA